MSEYTRLKAKIARLKAQEMRASRIGRAKSQIRELKYGRYFKPGRRAVGWIKKKVSEGTGNFGGNDMFSGLDMGNPFGGGGAGPLADIGDGFGGISMGNPFGEQTRRASPHRRRRVVHHRRPTHRRRPQYIIVRR
jgi:hypothetical protein